MKLTVFIFILWILLAGVPGSEKYYSEADFHKIKKIDAHIHIRTTSDAVSEQAREDSFLLINVNVASSDSDLQDQEKYIDFQVAAHRGQIMFLDAFSMKNWDSPD